MADNSLARYRGSVIDTIGNTPLVRINHKSNANFNVYAKVESFNPGLSIKDRVALRLIESGEEKGLLKKGDTVIERTSGNMGTGLAIVCQSKGYRFIAVMSEGNSLERRRMLSAFGAEVILVPQAEGGKSGFVSGEDLALVEEKTVELTEEYSAYRPDQFNNPENARAHELTTGQEIWKQLGGSVSAFVSYVGSGGTFVGVSRALKKHDDAIKCFPIEPQGAPYLAGHEITSTRHRIQGGGYAFKPAFWDESLPDGFLTVTDDEAMKEARKLAAEEGIFAGFSSGANIAGASKLKDLLGGKGNVVTVLPDSGLKYLSTDLFP